MKKKYLSREAIVGKQVIDSNGIIVGDVKEVTFESAMKTIALNVTAKEGHEITIESNNISAFGDVVLLKPKEQPPTAVPTASGLCRICGYQNSVSAIFCIKCGTKLQ